MAPTSAPVFLKPFSFPGCFHFQTAFADLVISCCHKLSYPPEAEYM